MITFSSSGSFNRTDSFLSKMLGTDLGSLLQSAGAEGVAALRSATPMDSGLTAASWNYEINRSRGSVSIAWTNSHTVNGTKIAVILQYGHGTGTGGYVAGRDYINPALQPVFDRIANDVWKAVTSA